MSKLELETIQNRVDEIDQIIDLCDPHWDADVLENLELELEQIIFKLEKKI